MADTLDVFISYAREDRATAQALAGALSAAGLNVWWDRQIVGGQDFTDVIAERLGAAQRVLVLWSRASVGSSFVRDEAAHARDAGKLLPLRIDEVRPPLGFGTIHTLDLLDWRGDTDSAAWADLIAALRGERTAAVPADWHAAPWWRRRRVLGASAAVLALGAAGSFGWHTWRQEQAQTQFEDGLRAHFARDPNLQAARNAYLNALRANPALGRAHYYLAHVYALLILPDDARAQFVLALRFEADLDGAQRADAHAQLALLQATPALAPVARATTDSAPPAPKPATGSSPPRETAGAAPRPAAPAQLPRVPPPAERSRAVDTQVAALFDVQAQTRLSAATALALDPAMLSDAVPLALQRATQALAQPTPDAAALAGATNTLQLLLSASPATLQANRDALTALLDRAAPLGDNLRVTADKLRALADQARSAAPPVAYIQIASDAQRPLANALAVRIRAAGYTVPGIENVGTRAPSRSEVRVQGASVQGWGRWLDKIVAEFSGEAVRTSTLRSARPRTDTFEIWLDKDLCVTRQVPACSG